MNNTKSKYIVIGIIAAVLILSASIGLAHNSNYTNRMMDTGMNGMNMQGDMDSMMNGMHSHMNMSGMMGNNADMDKNKDGVCDMCGMKMSDCDGMMDNNTGMGNMQQMHKAMMGD